LPDSQADDWYWDKYVKGVSIGDSFYFTMQSSALILSLFKFSFTGSVFEIIASYPFTDTPVLVGPPNLLAMDMIADSSNVYVSMNRGGSNRRLYKFEPTFSSPLILNSTATWFH
jgi:hypothetical protein